MRSNIGFKYNCSDLKYLLEATGETFSEPLDVNAQDKDGQV